MSMSETPEFVTMNVPVYRRWWQLWKPRVVGTELATFKMIEGGHSVAPLDLGPSWTLFSGVDLPEAPSWVKTSSE